MLTTTGNRAAQGLPVLRGIQHILCLMFLLFKGQEVLAGRVGVIGSRTVLVLVKCGLILDYFTWMIFAPSNPLNLVVEAVL